MNARRELQQQTHYCPGCGHGVAHKLIAEALTELGLQDRAVLVSPGRLLGLCLLLLRCRQCAGRARPRSGGGHRAQARHPESIVMAYQGDGDLAAIGTAEIIHAANRGENICVFFVNNSDLRHDRRPDGAHHPGRPGELRPRPGDAAPTMKACRCTSASCWPRWRRRPTSSASRSTT